MGLSFPKTQHEPGGPVAEYESHNLDDTRWCIRDSELGMQRRA